MTIEGNDPQLDGQEDVQMQDQAESSQTPAEVEEAIKIHLLEAEKNKQLNL